MKAVRYFLAAPIFSLLSVCQVFAGDFYGASVTDKDMPSSFMRFGIYGDHPVVGSVVSGSVAESAGFEKGDVVILINQKSVGRAADLATITDDNLIIRTFDGSKWKKLTINRVAVEEEKARQRDAERKTATAAATNGAPSSSPNYRQFEASAPVKFDDSDLSDVTINVVADQPDVLDHSSAVTSKQNLFDVSGDDLAGIDW